MSGNDLEKNPYFLTLTSELPELVWVSRDFGEWVWSSTRWNTFTGQNETSSRHLGWLRAVHPDDRAAFVDAWARAEEREQIDVEHRLISSNQEDEARWFRTRAVPLPPIAGQPREWCGACIDIHDQRLLRDRHRMSVSTILSLIRTMVRRTVRDGTVSEAVAAHLDSRLSAMSRTQTLIRQPDAVVELADLVEDALIAHAVHEGDRVSIAGPQLGLRSNGTAELLGMVLHELTMNTVEHGALSNGQGVIAIEWQVVPSADGDALNFTWIENGGPSSATEARVGFGRELIETLLAAKLNAKGTLDLVPGGLNCRIAIPCADNVVLREAEA